MGRKAPRAQPRAAPTLDARTKAKTKAAALKNVAKVKAVARPCRAAAAVKAARASPVAGPSGPGRPAPAGPGLEEVPPVGPSRAARPGRHPPLACGRQVEPLLHQAPLKAVTGRDLVPAGPTRRTKPLTPTEPPAAAGARAAAVTAVAGRARRGPGVAMRSVPALARPIGARRAKIRGAGFLGGPTEAMRRDKAKRPAPPVSVEAAITAPPAPPLVRRAAATPVRPPARVVGPPLEAPLLVALTA